MILCYNHAMLTSYKTTYLSNGIGIVTLEKPDAQSVQIAIHVRVGSRNEPFELNGASHFIEHMLFKGTRKRSAKKISQTIESVGGAINAFTDRDNTCYYTKVPYNKSNVAFNVLSDLFYNSTFDEKEFDRERQVIIEEIRMYDDQPDSVALDALLAQLWSGHPLGRPILGPIDIVQNIQRDDIVRYKEEQYAPERTLFSFIGKINHETCVKWVKSVASHLENSAIIREPETYSRAIPLDPFTLIRRDIQQTHIALGWRTPGFADSKDGYPYAVVLLSTLLGESMMSRLFQTIRERRGLCYNINSFTSLCADSGALIITAGCDPKKAYQGTKAVLAEIRKLIEKPISKAELKRTVEYLCGRFRLRLDSMPMGWIAGRVLFTQPVNPEEMIERFRALTPEDIQNAAKLYLQPHHLAMTIVAPHKVQKTASLWASLMKY